MGKSFIDAIGREKAFELMQNAVLQAIDENQTLGFGRSSRGKKVRMVDGVLCIVSAGNTAPLVAVQLSFGPSGSLKKSVPVA